MIVRNLGIHIIVPVQFLVFVQGFGAGFLTVGLGPVPDIGFASQAQF
jgi:hypothetical protein